MAEMNNGDMKKFVPRPKPTLSEVKESGVKNIIGIVPRPKPNFSNAPKVPPRPKPQQPKMPPRPKPQPQPKPIQNVQNQNSATTTTQATYPNAQMAGVTDPYSFQAYNSMLNNIQFMNALGLVNGIYQNAQQSTKNSVISANEKNIDKQTLFDEFYEYVTEKMKEKGQISEKKTQDDGLEDVGNIGKEAVFGAKREDISLDKYLEKMCNEDEFLKFDVVNLQLDDSHKTPIFSTVATAIKNDELGNVLSVEEYTQKDYENLVNKNFNYFIADKESNQEIVDDELPEMVENVSNDNIKETEQSIVEEKDTSLDDTNIKENVENVSSINESEDTLLSEEEDNKEIKENTSAEIESADKEDEQILQDVPNLFELDDENLSDEEINEKIFDLLEDDEKTNKTKDMQEDSSLSDLSSVQDFDEKELILGDYNSAKIENKEANIVRKARNRKSKDIYNAMSEEQNEDISKLNFDDLDIEANKNYIINSQGKEEIFKNEKDKLKNELDKVYTDNNDLKVEIDELKNIIDTLKVELGNEENEKLELKEKYALIDKEKENKEIELANAQKQSSSTKEKIDELQSENEFMRSVVNSLMVEIEELKQDIKNKESKEIKNVTQNQSNIKQETKDIKQLDEDKEVISLNDEDKEIVDSAKDIEETAVVNDVNIENSEIDSDENNEEVYSKENLQEVSEDIFNDEDIYNIDGIIVEEDTIETSQHFVDKMKLATKDIQDIYNEIRNEIMSYKDVKGRCSSACDTFRLNGDIIAKFLLIGKTIKLYLALNPEDPNLPQNIYHQKNESKKKAYKDTPFMVKLQSGLSIRKAKKLIAYMFDELDVVKNPRYEEVDYVESLERQTVKKK